MNNGGTNIENKFKCRDGKIQSFLFDVFGKRQAHFYKNGARIHKFYLTDYDLMNGW